MKLPRILGLGVLSIASPCLHAQDTTDTSTPLVMGRFDVTEERTDYSATTATAGTRTNTSLLDTPASVNVINSELIKDQSIQTLEQAIRNAPGITQGSNLGNRSDSLVIRGFTTSAFINSDFYKDGFRDHTRSLRDMINVDRIEVLKGPAAVLYGRGQPTGAVVLVTKKPLDVDFDVASFEIGSYDSYRLTLDSTGPVPGDSHLFYRLTADADRANSFRDYLRNRRYFVSPVALYRFDKNTTLTVSFEYLYENTPTDRGLVAIGRGIAPIPRSEYLGEPAVDKTWNVDARAGYEFKHAFNANWSMRHAFQTTWSLEDRSNAQPGNALAANNQTLSRTFTKQVTKDDSYFAQTEIVGDFGTGFFKNEILLGNELGTEGQDTRSRTAPAAPINIFAPVYNPVPTGPWTPSSSLVSGDEAGFYAQDQITLADRLHFLLGGRYDDYLQTNLNRLSTVKQDKRNFQTTPRTGVVYDVVPDTSVYAAYSKSFSPQLGTTYQGATFAPTQGISEEAGLKQQWGGGRLSATAAVYRIDQANLTTPDPSHSGYSILTGEARSQGVELEVAGRLAPGWNTIATYAYTDARVTGSTSTPIGTLLDDVPFNQFSVWNTYELQSGAAKGLGAGAGVYYVGKRGGDVADDFDLPAYTDIDLTFFYQRKRVRYQVNIKNLLNRDYFLGSTGRTDIAPGAPLSVYGSVTYEFR